MVKDDFFTSVHIEEFECVARDTKLGPEEITRDIPNVGEDALKDLDESGIIRIGAEVRPGDILVGKITPKGETQLSPEEKLLRAIFGEKAGEVRDTSLKVPPGVEGTVINARVFSRKGVSKDERSRLIEEEETAKLKKDQEDEQRIIRESTLKHLKKLLRRQGGRGAPQRRPAQGRARQGQDHRGDRLRRDPDQPLGRDQGRRREDRGGARRASSRRCRSSSSLIRLAFQEKLERLKSGDELPPGVIKMVKVFVAIKRKLQVGDKMAGRHGNKGVLSRILPEEDMPYLEDGTPVDVVLNPLGVPSRMNLGQILETHLGWAARALGGAAGRAKRTTTARPTPRRCARRCASCTARTTASSSTSCATRTSCVWRDGRRRRRAHRLAGVRRRLRGRGLQLAQAGRSAGDAARRACSTAAAAMRSRTRSPSASCTC